MKIIPSVLLLVCLSYVSAQDIIRLDNAILTRFESPQEAVFNAINWDSTPWDYYQRQPQQGDRVRVYKRDSNEALELPIPSIQSYNEGSFPVINFLETANGAYTQFYQVYLRQGQIMDVSLYADNFRPSLSFRRPRGEIIVVDRAEQREDGSYYSSMMIDAGLTGTYIVAIRAETELEDHGEYHFTFEEAPPLFPELMNLKDKIVPRPQGFNPPSRDLD